MAVIVNLRSARKRRQREDAEALAAENRVRHGLPRAVRTAADTEAKRSAGRLEAHRLGSAETADASEDR